MLIAKSLKLNVDDVELDYSRGVVDVATLAVSG
jgi:hypothetical protein